MPQIRAEAKAAGATVYFADEAGLRSDYHAGTTWAPVGQTPVVKAAGARHSLNMISAVTAQGQLRFSTYTGSFTAGCSSTSAASCSPTPTGRSTWSSTATPPTRPRRSKSSSPGTDGRLKLFILPAYLPQLNPDEWVWKNVKHDRLGRTSVHDADEFKPKVVGALRRLQKLPDLVRGFFRDPHLAYLTA